MRIVLATRNQHKLTELADILAGSGVEVLCLDDIDGIPEVPEEQETFEGNALQKAHFVFERTGITTVADDSGIAVDALGGAPGVYSKRYTPEATAEANNTKLLQALQGAGDRTARFVCAMAIVSHSGENVCTATCEGQIAHAHSGAGGFGYDPIFLPDETPGRSMAQLSPQEKNAISHRGRAFSKLPALLNDMMK